MQDADPSMLARWKSFGIQKWEDIQSTDVNRYDGVHPKRACHSTEITFFQNVCLLEFVRYHWESIIDRITKHFEMIL